MAESIILETGVTIDNQALRELLGRTGISGYVENGLGFDPNWSDGILNVSPGKVFLLDAHRDYPLLADGTIDVAFSQGTVSDVYAIYNEDAAESERADVVAVAGSDGPPTNPSLLIGRVDDTDQSFVELNRDTPVASPLEDGDADGFLEIPNHQGIENDHDALVNVQPGQHHDRPQAGDGLDEDGSGRFNVDESEISLPDPHDRPIAGDGLDESNGRFNVDESEIDFPPGGVYVNALEFPGSTGGVKIQNALDSLPAEGGTVYVPNTGPDGGNWNCGPTGGVMIPGSNITLLSAGAKLFLPSGTAETAIIETNDYQTHAENGDNGTNKRNIRIEGFECNGNGGSSQGANQPCIAILNADNSVVRDCYCHDLGYGVNVKQSQHVSVENVRAIGALDDNIAISETHTGSDNAGRNRAIKVVGCTANQADDNGIEIDDGGSIIFVSNCHAENNGGAGIETHSHNLKPSGTGVEAAGPTNRLMVTNCSAIENDGDGFRVARNSAGQGAGFIFTNLISWNNGSACFTLDDTPQGGDRGQTMRRVYLSNFYFRRDDNADSSSAVILNQEENPIRSIGISNGMIYGNGSPASGGGYNGISISGQLVENVSINNVEIANVDFGIGLTQPVGSDNIRIANCLIRDCDRTGIRFAGNGVHNGFQVVNNRIIKTGQGTSGGDANDSGIRLMGGNSDFDNGVIVGNSIQNAAHGMHIGSGNAPIDNFVVGLNNCWGCDSGLTSGRDDSEPPFGPGSEVALNIFP